MMTAICMFVGVLFFGLVLALAVGLYVSDYRRRPICPVHKRKMILWSDGGLGVEEYTCPIKSCPCCANVSEGGDTRFFTRN